FSGTGAVCEGYARSFQLLLNYNNVNNIFVTGTVKSGEHAWNLVQLDDGEWYWFDLTFDDWGKDHKSWDNDTWGIDYTYFAALDEKFLANHTAHTSSGSDVSFLYDLPSRATSDFTANYPLLNHKIEFYNARYTVVGYKAVQLNQMIGSGSIILPETVAYNGVDYTLISIGCIEAFGVEVFPRIYAATEVTVPKTVKNICSGAFRTWTLENIYVDSDNEYFTSRDGVLFTKSLYTLIQYPTNSRMTEYTIPDETHQVAYNAMGDWGYDEGYWYRIHLERLIIGKNVKYFGTVEYQDKAPTPGSFGGNTIYGELQCIANVLSGESKIIVSSENKNFVSDGKAIYCDGWTVLYCLFDKSATEFTIHANTVRFEFDYWYSQTSSYFPLLERILVDEDNLLFSSIDGVLYNYDKTRIMLVPPAFKGHLEIPDGVIHITDSTLDGCDGVTTITIPNTVLYIEEGAIWKSMGSFDAVYYRGTEEEWKAIEIGNYNSGLTDDIIHYYSETEPPLNDDGTAYDGNYWRYVDGVPTAWVYTENE
ncbi:MAG: leucine-rich repeat protein, partial [Clostridia bacterium]|nr:leucine-rich repeat protein [Clostridia bacterium]